MTVELVYQKWVELKNYLPVDWNDKNSIKHFKIKHDEYAKMYQRLDVDNQGEVSYIIANKAH